MSSDFFVTYLPDRSELVLAISSQSHYEIIARSTASDYYPQTILGTSTGLHTVAFDAPEATGLILRGNGIALAALRVRICSKEGSWTRIKEKCGCGLPINQEKTNYMAEAYPPIMGNDLVAVLCRLGVQTLEETAFTFRTFLNLKAMLLSMLPEGILVPWGWTRFPTVPNDSTTAESDNQLNYSKYDFLLTQSHHVFYAKILDLYFVDKDIDAETYYDYKVTATWPESNLRDLEHEITFEDYEVDQTFYPVCILDETAVLLASSRPEIVAESYATAGTERVCSLQQRQA